MTNEELKRKLLSGKPEDIQDIVDHVHPADILELVHDDEDSAKDLLLSLPDEMIADVLEEEDEDERFRFLTLFFENRQKAILNAMEDDELADMIGELNKDEQTRLLDALEPEARAAIENLLQYEPDTAGGIMTLDFINIHANNSVMDTLNYLHTQTIHEMDDDLFVTDKRKVLKGVVSLRDLVAAPFDTPIMDITNTNVHYVHPRDDQEDVASQFVRYGYLTMPVVDKKMRVLGVIEIDDIMDVIEEETTEDINRLGGTSGEEKVDSTVSESVHSRLPWLVVNLFTAVMAAAVVAHFEGTIARVVSLSAVMSIVTGMGGNAGTQSLTILVRGLSLGEVDRHNAIKIFLKEITVGLLTGIAIGVIVGVGSMIFQHNAWFGLVAGLAMILNMIVANLAGFLVPIILERFHVDPALASGVFVTTVTDCLGFFFFLGLATLFLPLLI